MRISTATLSCLLTFAITLTSCKETGTNDSADRVVNNTGKGTELEGVAAEMAERDQALGKKIVSEGRSTAEDFEAIRESNKSHAKKLEALGGSDAVQGKIIAAVSEIQDAHAKNLDPALVRQASDYISLYTMKDYDYRIAEIKKYEKYNQEVIQYYKGGELLKKVKKIIEESDVSSSEKANLLKEWGAELKEGIPLIIIIRNCDATGVESLTKALNLLKKDDGKWHIENQKVVFENNDSLQKFNGYSSSLQKAGQIQREAQLKMLR